MSGTNNVVKYNLTIEFNEKWVEGMGIEGLSEWIRSRIELSLGSHPIDRGKIKKFKIASKKSTKGMENST